MMIQTIEEESVEISYTPHSLTLFVHYQLKSIIDFLFLFTQTQRNVREYEMFKRVSPLSKEGKNNGTA